eukprot:1082312-Amphidinium_carterae.1
MKSSYILKLIVQKNAFNGERACARGPERSLQRDKTYIRTCPTYFNHNNYISRAWVRRLLSRSDFSYQRRAKKKDAHNHTPLQRSSNTTLLRRRIWWMQAEHFILDKFIFNIDGTSLRFYPKVSLAWAEKGEGSHARGAPRMQTTSTIIVNPTMTKTEAVIIFKGTPALFLKMFLMEPKQFLECPTGKVLRRF